VRWIIDIEWMDGDQRTVGNIGQFGPGVVENGALLCYTKENRYADAKLTEIIPLVNVRRFKITEESW
jgi:hypothetical protein